MNNMKQTSNYQFNLIESSDTFSPSPLNDNMLKTEEALVDLDANCRESLAAAMAAIGSGGSTARIAFGSWTGNGASGRTLTFDFKPVLVIAMQYNGKFCTTTVRGANGSQYNNSTVSVQWAEKSVTFVGPTDTTHLNSSGTVYYYVAIGV